MRSRWLEEDLLCCPVPIWDGIGCWVLCLCPVSSSVDKPGTAVQTAQACIFIFSSLGSFCVRQSSNWFVCKEWWLTTVLPRELGFETGFIEVNFIYWNFTPFKCVIGRLLVNLYSCATIITIQFYNISVTPKVIWYLLATSSHFVIKPEATTENNLFFSKSTNKDFTDAQCQNIYNGITKFHREKFTQIMGI